MCSSARRCWNIPLCRKANSSASNNSSNCAGWKTAGRFAWPKWSTTRSAWTCRKTWRASRNCCKVRAENAVASTLQALTVCENSQPRGSGADKLLCKAPATQPSFEALLLGLQDSNDDALRATIVAILEERELRTHDVHNHVDCRSV